MVSAHRLRLNEARRGELSIDRLVIRDCISVATVVTSVKQAATPVFELIGTHWWQRLREQVA